jgi:hypothetical protein
VELMLFKGFLILGRARVSEVCGIFPPADQNIQESSRARMGNSFTFWSLELEPGDSIRMVGAEAGTPASLPHWETVNPNQIVAYSSSLSSSSALPT